MVPTSLHTARMKILRLPGPSPQESDNPTFCTSTRVSEFFPCSMSRKLTRIDNYVLELTPSFCPVSSSQIRPVPHWINPFILLYSIRRLFNIGDDNDKSVVHYQRNTKFYSTSVPRYLQYQLDHDAQYFLDSVFLLIPRLSADSPNQIHFIVFTYPSFN